MNASVSWACRIPRSSSICSGLNSLPRVPKRLAHMVTYASSMPGTAGRLISPVATDRRNSRRVMAR